MEEILAKIAETIERYEGGEYLTPERLRELLRTLSAQTYYLTTYKIEYKQRYNEIQYRHKGSVASGEILAQEQIPELYQCRYIIRAANNVMESMKEELRTMRKDG